MFVFICRLFKEENIMKKHIKYVHLTDVMTTCPFCNKVWDTEKLINKLQDI